MACKPDTTVLHGDWVSPLPEPHTMGQVIGHDCDGLVLVRFGREVRKFHPSRLARRAPGHTRERTACARCAAIRQWIRVSAYPIISGLLLGALMVLVL